MRIAWSYQRNGLPQRTTARRARAGPSATASKRDGLHHGGCPVGEVCLAAVIGSPSRGARRAPGDSLGRRGRCRASVVL
jgi:hypothetical protein